MQGAPCIGNAANGGTVRQGAEGHVNERLEQQVHAVVTFSL